MGRAGDRWIRIAVTGLLQPASLAAAPTAQRQRPLQLALASYTTRKFDLDQTLKMTQRVGLPAGHLSEVLPFASGVPPQVIAAAAETVKKAGVDLHQVAVW